jgi:hypothetical protein
MVNGATSVMDDSNNRPGEIGFGAGEPSNAAGERSNAPDEIGNESVGPGSDAGAFRKAPVEPHNEPGEPCKAPVGPNNGAGEVRNRLVESFNLANINGLRSERRFLTNCRNEAGLSSVRNRKGVFSSWDSWQARWDWRAGF